MECENSAYARDGKMESPGGVATVPARRVGAIHKEMVAQRCAGVKVQGYGPNLPSGLRDRVGTGEGDRHKRQDKNYGLWHRAFQLPLPWERGQHKCFWDRFLELNLAPMG